MILLRDGALSLALVTSAEAADVLLQRRTKSGSDVTIFSDGSAALSNPARRWAAAGSWKKEGGKYCVDWREREWPRQCYW